MPVYSPKDAEQFFLGDFDLYLADETLPAAYTMAEKALTFSADFAEFLEGIPQVLVRKDLVRFGVAMGVSFAEWTEDLMELCRGGEKVAGSGYDNLYFGTDYEEPPVVKHRYVGKKVNSKIVEFVLLRAKAVDFAEIATGGTEYNMIPNVFEALKDDTVTNEKRNLAFFRFEN